MSLSMQDLSLEEDSFDAYCIVCDRLIVPPKEKEAVPKPKKKPAGAIRVKNPDGSTTTRTANGTKTTRPALKRNPNSSTRLVTVAANNHAASKLAPLSRTKTTDSKSSNGEDDKTGSSTSTVTIGAHLTSPINSPFASSIYCSQACAQIEQGRCESVGQDLARTFSGADLNNYQHHRPSMDGIITNIDIHNHPYAPPSPLFVSSDTESSNSLGAAADAGPASSAPKVMEYFRMSRGGPDDAWNDIQRQRRSSMNPSFARPADMTRQNTQTSSHYTFSSDSLSSMWDSDAYLGRSTSGSGKMRMTPMSHPDDSPTDAHPSGSASGYGYSSGPAPIPTRPVLPRSNLSHTSLGGSSSPSESLLLKSYAEGFHGGRHSSSYSNRGSLAIPPSTSPLDARRASMHSHMRPSTGTIRAKSSMTWDSLGKQAVQERAQACRLRRAESHVSTSGLAVPNGDRDGQHHDVTPRQSLKVENGQWKVVHRLEQASLGKNGTIRCKSRADSRSTQASSTSSGSGSASDAQQRRPSSASFLAPPLATPASAIASSPSSTMTIPCSSTPMPALAPHIKSPGPNWGDYEIKGGKTYAIPAGLKTQKTGLFYFNQ